MDDDGRLIIGKVKLEDAGSYVCVAENIAGRTEKVLDLVVTRKSFFTSNKRYGVINLSFNWCDCLPDLSIICLPPVCLFDSPFNSFVQSH